MKMTLKDTVAEIKAGVHADQIAVKDNRVTFRRGFFYRMGGSAETFSSRIMKDLANLGIQATLVNQGEVWKAFRGGAKVANSSHWFATVELK